jgi:hypothetical protein
MGGANEGPKFMPPERLEPPKIMFEGEANGGMGLNFAYLVKVKGHPWAYADLMEVHKDPSEANAYPLDPQQIVEEIDKVTGGKYYAYRLERSAPPVMISNFHISRPSDYAKGALFLPSASRATWSRSHAVTVAEGSEGHGSPAPESSPSPVNLGDLAQAIETARGRIAP